MAIKDKVVLITGSTGSLGRALTQAFATAGARLALGVHHMETVHAVQQELLGRGLSAFVVPCDLRYEEDVVRMIHRVVRHYGRVDVVVNAASEAGPREAIEDYPIEPWRTVMATNVTGTFLVCREVIPWMKRQGGGCILNVTSPPQGGSKASRAACGAQWVSQYAVEGLTRALAAELKGTGVRVNTVEVGMTSSEAKAGADGTAWVEAFLLLADQTAVASGQMVVAAQFAKPAASV